MNDADRPFLTPGQWTRLRSHMRDALHHQDDVETGRVAARQLDLGKWRLRWVFDQTDAGEADVASARLVVDIQNGDEWQPLVRVPWSQLGMDMDDVLLVHTMVMRQQDRGIYPGGPVDPMAE